MTLAEWSTKSGIQVERSGTGGTYVYVSDSVPMRRDLWSLSDYRVSSVAGLVIWLVPTLSGSLNAKVEEQRRRDAENIAAHAVQFSIGDGSGVYITPFFSGPPGCNIGILRPARSADHPLRERLGCNVAIPLADLPAVIAKLQSMLPA